MHRIVFVVIKLGGKMQKRKIKKFNLLMIAVFAAGTLACGSQQAVVESESTILNETLANSGEAKADIEYIDDEIEIETKGLYEVSDEQSWSEDRYESKEADISTVVVTDQGSLLLSEVEIGKSGDTTEEENSKIYGKNAALLVKGNGKAETSGGSIETDGKGASAVFTGSGAETLLKNINLHTKGSMSPCLSSAGEINIIDSSATSEQSSVAVIEVTEGNSAVHVSNSTLTAYEKASTDEDTDRDSAGIKFYERIKEDSIASSSEFSADDSTITISENSEQYKTAPMFLVSNSDTAIRLNNTTLNYGSGILLDVIGNNGVEDHKGTNGGNAELTANNQELIGNITLDQISSVIVSLDNSRLESQINGDNTGDATVIMDKDSVWDVTGDSYIVVLTNEDESCSNIISNGHTVYYDAENSANSWLEERTIPLIGGGSIMPLIK